MRYRSATFFYGFMSKNYQIDIDGYIGDYSYSKRYVKNVLGQNKGKEVSVRLNSLGGSLDHGLDIADQFVEHGNVNVYMFGFNASSSTVASLGAKRVYISDTGFYLAHKVMNWVDAWGYMNADEMADTIADLEQNKKENEKIDLVLAQKYAKKSGKSISEIMNVLKAGAWLNAQEALEYGFVDEIIKSNEKVNFTPELKEKFNAFGLPLPKEPQSETQNNADTGSIVKTIKECFQELLPQFNNKKNNPPQVEKMKKDNFKKVNGVLAVEHLEFSNGKVMLSEEELQKIEDSLAEKDNSISEKDKEIGRKDEQIKNLKENPGDDTTQVHDGEDDEEGKSNDVYSSSKELFNQVEEYLN